MTTKKEIIQQQMNETVQALTILKDEEGVPKNVRIKLESILTILNEESEPSLKIGKSLHILEEISEDLNLPSFIRTQVWNVSSMLEKLN